MYYIGDTYQGTYSNNADLRAPVTTDKENFGLDEYEPLFFHPLVSFTIAKQMDQKIALTIISSQLCILILLTIIA